MSFVKVLIFGTFLLIGEVWGQDNELILKFEAILNYKDSEFSSLLNEFLDELELSEGSGKEYRDFIKYLKQDPSKLVLLAKKEADLLEGYNFSINFFETIQNNIKIDKRTFEDLVNFAIEQYALKQTFRGLFNVIKKFKLNDSVGPDDLRSIYSDKLYQLLELQDSRLMDVIRILFDEMGPNDLSGKILEKIEETLKKFRQNSPAATEWEKEIHSFFSDYYVYNISDICLASDGFATLLKEFIGPNLAVVDELLETRSGAICHDFGLSQFLENGMRNEGMAAEEIQEKLSQLPLYKEGNIIKFIEGFLVEVTDSHSYQPGDLVLYKDIDTGGLVHTSVVYKIDSDEKEVRLISKWGTMDPLWSHKACYTPTTYLGPQPKYYRLNKESVYKTHLDLYNGVIKNFKD